MLAAAKTHAARTFFPRTLSWSRWGVISRQAVTIAHAGANRQREMGEAARPLEGSEVAATPR
jgi:hypothetical protein